MRFLRRKKTPSAVDAALKVSLALLPTSGDLPTLLNRVAERRGRPIVVSHWQAGPSDPSGLWIAMDDRDHIIVEASATPGREAAIICHELGHIMLGHQGTTAALADAGSSSRVAPDIAPEVAARFMTRHGYEAEYERDAEVFGTHLAAEVARRRYAVSADYVTNRLR